MAKKDTPKEEIKKKEPEEEEMTTGPFKEYK